MNPRFAVDYVDPPDVPAGMTLAEYRRQAARPARRGPRRWAGRLRRGSRPRRRVG